MTRSMEDMRIDEFGDLDVDPREQFGYQDAPAGVHDNFKVRSTSLLGTGRPRGMRRACLQSMLRSQYVL